MFNSIPLRVKFADEEMTKKYRSSKAGGKQRKCQEMKKPIPTMVMQDIYDLGTEAQQNYPINTLDQVSTLHSIIVGGQFSECMTQASLLNHIHIRKRFYMFVKMFANLARVI